MAADFLVAQGQTALEEDDGNGQRDHREQQVTKHHFRGQEAQDRTRQDAPREKEQDRGHAHTPG